MNRRKPALLPMLIVGSLLSFALATSCKDNDPCDPGQVERNSQCYPVSASGGSGGSDDGGPDAGAAGESATLDTPFGTPCTDSTGSSDCGGIAPVCADLTPLGQSVMCTQLNCAAGEQNAGVCPSGFRCFAVSGYPSICISD